MARIIIVNAAGRLVLPDAIEARQVEREATALARITDPYIRQRFVDAIVASTGTRRRQTRRELATA